MISHDIYLRPDIEMYMIRHKINTKTFYSTTCDIDILIKNFGIFRVFDESALEKSPTFLEKRMNDILDHIP